jgi:hypothetical protein
MREPKLIRAGSHSCNVAAAHLAEIDQLDIFFIRLCAYRAVDGCGPAWLHLWKYRTRYAYCHSLSDAGYQVN